MDFVSAAGKPMRLRYNCGLTLIQTRRGFLMSDTPVDSSKRIWLVATGAAGAVGAVAVATPFVSTFQPSEKAKAAGAAVEVDISALKPGEKVTVEWRGKPVWIMKRTPEQLESLKKTEAQVADPLSDRKAYPTPEYAKNQHRSIKPEVLVAVGDAIGIAGGWLVGVNRLGFNSTTYLQNTVDFLETWDVVSGLWKGAAFGFIVALMGCYHGMNSGRGAQGVGAATKSAVVGASVLILAANYILTELFFSA